MVAREYLVSKLGLKVGDSVKFYCDGQKYAGEVRDLGPRGLRIEDSTGISEGVNYGKIRKFQISSPNLRY